MKLTYIELEQLLSYVEDRGRIGWYYGNKEQFERRHKNIQNELEKLLVLYRTTPTKETGISDKK